MLIAIAAALVLGAFGISAVLTPVSRSVARRMGMIDRPGGRKAHTAATPLLGGSAICLAVIVPVAAGLALAWLWDGRAPSWVPQAIARHAAGGADVAPMGLGLLAGALALHVLGLIDDRRRLRASVKLAGQLLIVGAVVGAGGVRVLTFAGPGVSIAATILWLVAIINAFNLLDNMDGLSAGVAAICAAALLAVVAQTGQWFVAAWLCVFLGAMLGYLPYNFPPASTFMGDGGSLVIGYTVGVLTCLTTYVPAGSEISLSRLMIPLVLLAVPLYDMGSVVLLRLKERHSVFAADRRHFSHRLVRRGMSPRAAVLTIYLCTAGTALAACLLPHTDNAGAIFIAGQTVLILAIIAVLEWPGSAPSDREAP